MSDTESSHILNFYDSFGCAKKGDDFGRVLVGIQVPNNDTTNDKVVRFLNTLHYNYVEETDNPIYHKFLRTFHLVIASFVLDRRYESIANGSGIYQFVRQ